MLGILLVAASAGLWYYYYKTKTACDDEYQQKEEYFRKHNCVVTYSKIHGVTGWPGFENDTTLISCNNCHDTFLPLLYFLSTTQETLDIAMMTLSSNVILSALFDLAKKGIKLRLVINYDQMLKKRLIKEFIKYGAEVVIYAGKNDLSSILHYKYAIKDYNSISKAMCCGSLNWTNTAFLNNYESITFTTNESIVDEFYKNFVESYNYVKNLMETDPYLPVLDLLS
ncbi:hypothetical protein AMK59_5917 [Oryctes borbonicus]|uniref:Mitochondrial cardiolipin hydrolase n=1 Tax=Oryctes borbonicus TaxID=1629725 RepID=A0A0T6B263_9SCAR|nr:hypothetical protein AMK59_5917 [Oryctes borbonicus]